jgi:hypothetical protein
MSGPVSLDAIKRDLAAQVDGLVPQLYPNARRAGGYWQIGSLAGEPGASLYIHRSGGRAGQWRDAASGESGSMLDLVAAAMFDGSFREALKWAHHRMGVLTPSELRQRERDAERAKARQADEDEARRVTAQKAIRRRFFVEARAIGGTPAETYLAGRGIHLRELGKMPGALRFHPGLLCPEHGGEHGILRPCLLALVLRGDGSPTALHRTFLHVHPDGRVTKASADPDLPMSNPKLSLGPVDGGFIPLWRGRSGKALKEAEASEWVILTEGIEDALSAAYELPGERIWAGISLANMGGLDFPPHLSRFWWHRHRDGEAATKQAVASIARLTGRGATVREIWAPEPFKDFNEARQAADRARLAMPQQGRVA